VRPSTDLQRRAARDRASFKPKARTVEESLTVVPQLYDESCQPTAVIASRATCRQYQH